MNLFLFTDRTASGANFALGYVPRGDAPGAQTSRHSRHRPGPERPWHHRHARRPWAQTSAATKTGENDSWGRTAALTAACGHVGPFGLLPAATDAALLATLAPGG